MNRCRWRHFARRVPRFVPKRITTSVYAIARDDTGVSAIEFAIVAPVVLLMVLGTMEIALDMTMDATVQMAAQAASRAGLVNVTPTGSTREAQAKSVAMGVIGMWANLPNTTVSISETTYANYAGVSSGTSTANSAGSWGSVVTYNISLTTQGATGVLKLFGVSSMTFSRSYLVQNEQ